MLPVVAELAAQKRADLLTALVDARECDVAMDAAAALAALGDPSKLPTWERATSLEAGFRAVCMLRHDRDKARAQTELSKFFHPTRRARQVMLHTTVNEFIKATPNQGDPREIAEAHRLLRVSDGTRGADVASIKALAAPNVDLVLRSRAFDPRGWPC